MPFPVNTIDGLFHDGNPATNTPGTVIDAEWLNAVQAAVIAMGTVLRFVAATYPLTATDGVLFCNTAGGSFTVTLPAAAGLSAGRRYVIKHVTPLTTANVLTLVAADGKTIDLAASIEIMGREGITVVFDGTNWETI